MYHKGRFHFTEQSKALTKRLAEKGYNENEIQQQISKTFTIPEKPGNIK